MLLLATKACFTTVKLALPNARTFTSRYAAKGDNSAFLRNRSIVEAKWFKKAYFGTIRSIDEANAGPVVILPKTNGLSGIIKTETGIAETAQAIRSMVQQGRQKKYIRKPMVRHTWSAAADILLMEGVALYKESGGWKRVAEHVGGVTGKHCRYRWHNYLSKSQEEGIKQGNWANEEVRQLEELVPQLVTKPRWSEKYKYYTRECIDWTAIGKVMSRDPYECKRKWHQLQYSRLKKGPFTAEEDALIRQRVAEWGDKGMGLWASLQQELGRPARCILERWHTCLAPKDVEPPPKVGVLTLAPISPLLLHKRPAPYKWTDFMDTRLTEGAALYKESGGWKRVAEHVGGGVTAIQCMNRWSHYLGKVRQEGLQLGAWSYKEVEQLKELVPQHVIKPRWSESRKVMTRERTDWVAIGKELKRIPRECIKKWNLLQESRMKKGPFTAKEDALIVKRVSEWGDQGNGLWVGLGEELGRAGKIISERWRKVLSKRQE